MATQDDITAFAKALQSKLAGHHANAKNVGDAPAISVEFGPKYARIVRTDWGDQRSVYGFVEIATGAILKAAGWKAPAKHARGNLNDAEPLARCGAYGVAYLR